MHTCPHCHGARTITVMVPNMKGPSNNRYQSNNPPTVARHYQCATCNSTGQVNCLKCADQGEYAGADPSGEFDCILPCDCPAGAPIRAAYAAEAAAEHDVFSAGL